MRVINQKLTRVIPSSLLKGNYSKINIIISVTVKVACSIDFHCLRKVEKLLCVVFLRFIVFADAGCPAKLTKPFFIKSVCVANVVKKIILVFEILKTMSIKFCGLFVTEEL